MAKRGCHTATYGGTEPRVDGRAANRIVTLCGSCPRSPEINPGGAVAAIEKAPEEKPPLFIRSLENGKSTKATQIFLGGAISMKGIADRITWTTFKPLKDVDSRRNKVAIFWRAEGDAGQRTDTPWEVTRLLH